MMSNKRGKRGRPKKFAVSLKITNEAQLQRTLDLCNVKGEKPHINDIIGVIVDRLEREEAAKSLALGKKWRKKAALIYGYPSSMFYDCMGEDDYPGFDDCGGYDVFDGLGHKSSKELKRLNKKLFKGNKGNMKHSVDNLWSERFSAISNGNYRNNVDLDNEEDYEESYKCIKFYSDIENELSCREFDSIKSFSDFCGSHGYMLSPTDYNNILNLSVVHCCLDPISLEYGDNEIITDNSYGALYWTVSEDISKHEESVCSSGLEARTLTD